MITSMLRASRILLLGFLLAPVPATAELILPSGFTSQVYVSGTGFEASQAQAMEGMPSATTLAFDDAGMLYLARSGRRYGGGGDFDDRWPIYRVPPGGARLTRDSEDRFFHG